MQLQRVPEYLHPTHKRIVFRPIVISPSCNALRHGLRTLAAISQALAALGLRIQQRIQQRQTLAHRLQCFVELFALRYRVGGQPPVVLAPRQAEIPHGLIQRHGGIGQIHKVTRARQRFHTGIARQLQHLRGGHTLAKEQTRRFRQLMRFIKDDGIGRRQQLRHPAITQRHIGKKQMVIDHHHIRIQRVLARLHHKAFIEVFAIGAQAVITRGRDIRPHTRVLRHIRKIGFVATLRAPSKAGDQL